MKKIMIFLIMMMLWIMAGNVFAEDLKYGFLNLSGTTYYLPAENMIAVGGGLDVATYKDIVSLRVEAATEVVKEGDADESTLVGFGLGASLNKLVTLIGAEWVANMNSNITAGALFDVNNANLQPHWFVGIGLINYTF